MKRKKLISLVLLSSLIFSMIGCSEKSTENSTEYSNDLVDNSKVEYPFNVDSEIYTIDKTKENMIKLGSFQSLAIMKVLKDHGVSTGFSEEKTKENNVCFNESPDSFQTDGSSGFQSYTPNFDKLNFVSKKETVEGNSYYLDYVSQVDKELKSNYRYSVTMDFPLDREFNLEDFPLLKDLIKSTISKDYDFEKLGILAKDYYNSVNDGSTSMEGEVRQFVGPYIVYFTYGYVETCDGVKSNTLKFGVRLRY